MRDAATSRVDEFRSDPDAGGEGQRNTDPDGLPSGLEDYQVLSKRQFAKLAGISMSTLDRSIAAGRGPQIVKLSPRRDGILTGSGNQWLRGRLHNGAGN